MRIAECGSRNKHAEDFYEEPKTRPRPDVPDYLDYQAGGLPFCDVRGPDANAWVSGLD
jgi:hypothetical protein